MADLRLRLQSEVSVLLSLVRCYLNSGHTTDIGGRTFVLGASALEPLVTHLGPLQHIRLQAIPLLDCIQKYFDIGLKWLAG